VREDGRGVLARLPQTLLNHAVERRTEAGRTCPRCAGRRRSWRTVCAASPCATAICISSGPMESFCKQLGLRLKGPGMRWSTSSIDPMAALVSRWALDNWPSVARAA